jgi:acetolactate synthase I/II/III large subunit
MSSEITGAEIVVRCLAEEGVEHVFGYPGGAVLYIYDAIFNQDKFKHILVRHEQAAIHAADAYSRSSNKIGVAIVTSGPGVTNAVTGLATAYMDSIPMVVISGQVPSHAIGQDAFQECDTVGITRPCVKHNFLVKDVRELASTIKKAFFIAQTGRPGPVLVDIPKDISMHKCAYEYPKELEMRSYRPVDKGHSGQIRKAVQLLLSAERPMIYTGGGVILANAAPELNKLVDRLGYPCTNTLMGLGAYRSSSDKFVGMPGMHGTYEANMTMQHCDVLIAIGARFDDRVIGNPKHFSSHPRKIIHIDIDPSSISKRVKVDIPIVGNVKDVLQEVLSQLDTAEAKPNQAALTSWWKQINQWRERDCLKYTSSTEVIKPQMVVEKLWDVTKGDAFITSDVGQHQMWAAQYYGFDKPRRWINSGGLGTMGFGLPSAIGAKVAQPDDTVVCLAGDGSLIMTCQEFATAVRHEVPVKVFLMNNGYFGMVRQWQELFWDRRYSSVEMGPSPDWPKLAEAFGAKGMMVDDKNEVEGAMRDALATEGPVLLDVRVTKEENCYPMIPAGAAAKDMVG